MDMTGIEMAINAAMKLLGVTPETATDTLRKIDGLQKYAQSVDARLAAIETNQKVILELLRGDMPRVIIPETIEDHTNG